MVQERECRCLRLAIRTANCVSRYLPRVADRCCSAPKSDVFVERNHDIVSTRGNHNANAGRRTDGNYIVFYGGICGVAKPYSHICKRVLVDVITSNLTAINVVLVAYQVDNSRVWLRAGGGLLDLVIENLAFGSAVGNEEASGAAAIVVKRSDMRRAAFRCGIDAGRDAA